MDTPIIPVVEVFTLGGVEKPIVRTFPVHILTVEVRMTEVIHVCSVGFGEEWGESFTLHQYV